jgi:DNA-binding MarR family transcriptional regulator
MTFDVEKNVGFLLAKAYQKVASLYREELAAFAITPPQFILLAYLWKRDSISQAELSEKTQIDRTTIVRIADRLAEKGLVEHQPQPGDRRIHLIVFTARGRELEEELGMAEMRVRRKMISRISPDEYETLQAAFKKTSRLMRDEYCMDWEFANLWSGCFPVSP